jgi:ankyrin repeat protein
VAGAQDEQCRWPALYYAAWQNYMWMAEWLLANGADVTIASGELDTPVHAAARHGHSEMLSLLIGSHVVNERNAFGKTPLDLARQKSNWECVGILEKALNLPISPEVTSPPKPLPKNWLMGDYGNGQKFYYNPFSGATSEKRPPDE